MTDKQIVRIERLGSKGDGIGADGQAYPFTLPGETVRSEPPHAVLSRSPARVEPACCHFQSCGGCSLQNMALDDYLAWKRQTVIDTLAQRGIEVSVDPCFPCDPSERRRVQFTARRTESGLIFGYHASASRRIITVEECPVLTPAITEALPILRKLAEITVPKKGELRLAVFATDLGLDVSLSSPSSLPGNVRRQATDFALKAGLPRLSLEGEILIEREAPTVRFGGLPVAVQPGGFAQATKRAESYMVGLAVNHLKGCKQVADLFAGAGTFSIPLALQSKVVAYESEAAALVSLDRAVRQAPKLGVRIKTLATERRDLHRRPVTARELKRVDGAVFDPPRAGAEVQCKELAKSAVRTVVAISCNPATFARDARILIDGGFELQSVAPVDQFLWTPHIELVALFRR